MPCLCAAVIAMPGMFWLWHELHFVRLLNAGPTGCSRATASAIASGALRGLAIDAGAAAALAAERAPAERRNLDVSVSPLVSAQSSAVLPSASTALRS